MKVKGICILNQKDIEDALKMEIRTPEPERGDFHLNFDITRVESFYRSAEGDITIHLYSGKYYAVRYSDELWLKLETYTQ